MQVSAAQLIQQWWSNFFEMSSHVPSPQYHSHCEGWNLVVVTTTKSLLLSNWILIANTIALYNNKSAHGSINHFAIVHLNWNQRTINFWPHEDPTIPPHDQNSSPANQINQVDAKANSNQRVHQKNRILKVKQRL